MQLDEQSDGRFYFGEDIFAGTRWVEAPKATSRHTRRLAELFSGLTHNQIRCYESTLGALHC